MIWTGSIIILTLLAGLGRPENRTKVEGDHIAALRPAEQSEVSSKRPSGISCSWHHLPNRVIERKRERERAYKECRSVFMRYHQWHSWYLCWTSVFDNILSYHRVQQPKSLVGRTNPSPSMAWFFLNPHNSIGFIYIIWFNNPLVNNPFKKRHGINKNQSPSMILPSPANPPGLPGRTLLWPFWRNKAWSLRPVRSRTFEA